MDLEELTAQIKQSTPEEKISKNFDDVLEILTAIKEQNELILKYSKATYNNIASGNKKFNEQFEKIVQILPAADKNINSITGQLTDIKRQIQTVITSCKYVDNLHLALLAICCFECLIIVYISFFK